MESSPRTHVAVVDEHEVFVLVHMECECEERPRGRLLENSLNELHRRTVRQLRLRERASARVIVRVAAPSGVFVV